MAVIEHFKRVGHIHAFWVITILVGVICAFLIKLPNAQTVTSYITFAATVASLLLALVAIFYAIVSSQGISENLGTLDASSSQLEDASRDLQALTSRLDSKFERVFDEFGVLSPAVKRISESVDAAINPAFHDDRNTGPSENKSIITTLTEYAPFDETPGAAAAWYLIARGIKSNKPMNVSTIFGSQSLYEMYVIGYLTALRLLQDEIEIKPIKDDNSLQNIYEFSSENLDTDKIISSVITGKMKSDYIAKIDEFVEKGEVGQIVGSGA